MINRLRTDGISWIILIGILLLFLEVSFFDGGVLIFLCIAAFCIYLGRKKLPSKSGRLLMWFGIIVLVVNIFNTVAFKFSLFALLLYVIFRYADSKKSPKTVQPSFKEGAPPLKAPVVLKRAAIQNEWFGRKKTPEGVYEWEDINVQGIIGDTVIDLGNTYLPKGTSVVTVRNILGNIEILVPYDVEVSIHHSVLAGAIEVFEHQEPRVFNESLYYQTPGYEEAPQKVKVVISMWVGDLEVKRT